MRTTLIAGCLLLLSQIVAVAGAPISRERAHQLAAFYFARYFRTGCGGTAEPTLHGDYWESTVRIGFAGKPSGTIRVHRHTGRVSYDRAFAFKPAVAAESLDMWATSLDDRVKNP